MLVKPLSLFSQDYYRDPNSERHPWDATGCGSGGREWTAAVGRRMLPEGGWRPCSIAPTAITPWRHCWPPRTTTTATQSVRCGGGVADAEARLTRHLAAIEAGVDPQALVSAMNTAQADKAAAHVELQNLPHAPRLTETEIRKLIDSLGDITAVLAADARSDKANLYQALQLHIQFRPQQQLAVVGADLGFSTGVRRGT
ncbi:hypothetical protein ACQP1G_24680 [Nocardia sp. CA-107356]|uniref:hypothetical protein n=1 Tax=Nocardia sp. CA-107356 TaxID=3239972 RepID=UPI003D93CBD5